MFDCLRGGTDGRTLSRRDNYLQKKGEAGLTGKITDMHLQQGQIEPGKSFRREQGKTYKQPYSNTISHWMTNEKLEWKEDPTFKFLERLDSKGKAKFYYEGEKDKLFSSFTRCGEFHPRTLPALRCTKGFFRSRSKVAKVLAENAEQRRRMAKQEGFAYTSPPLRRTFSQLSSLSPAALRRQCRQQQPDLTFAPGPPVANFGGRRYSAQAALGSTAGEGGRLATVKLRTPPLAWDNGGSSNERAAAGIVNSSGDSDDVNIVSEKRCHQMDADNDNSKNGGCDSCIVGKRRHCDEYLQCCQQNNSPLPLDGAAAGEEIAGDHAVFEDRREREGKEEKKEGGSKTCSAMMVFSARRNVIRTGGFQ